MKDIPHICPVCNSKVAENMDDAASSNSNGVWYDLWCPNCGSTAVWYDNGKHPWPARIDWDIPKIALDLYGK